MDNEKLDRILETVTTIKTNMEHLTSKLQDHETRIRAIEQSYWKLAGAASIMAAVFTYIARKFGF